VQSLSDPADPLPQSNKVLVLREIALSLNER